MPKHLSRITFLEPEVFDEPDCRALFIALRVCCQSANRFDREAFRTTLDESLSAVHDRLIGQVSPDLDEQASAREIESTAHRLRLQHDKAELSQIEVLLRDKDEERTIEDVQRLQERVGVLLKRKLESQKALNARTILGRI